MPAHDKRAASYRHQAAEHPARSDQAPGVFPRKDLKFHEGVLVSLELALRMIGITDRIPTQERQAKNVGVTCFGLGRLVGVWQLSRDLDHMGKAEDFQNARWLCVNGLHSQCFAAFIEGG